MISIKKRIVTLLLVAVIVCVSGCQSNEQPKEVSITRVIDMNVDKALEELKNCGVKNVTSNREDYSGYAGERLIVINQNISGSHMDNEEVKLEVKPLCEVKINISIDDESTNDYEVRVICKGKTVATIKKGENAEIDLDTLEVIYLTVVQNDNMDNYCGMGTDIEGRTNWDICLRTNDKLEVARERISQYIKE